VVSNYKKMLLFILPVLNCQKEFEIVNRTGAGPNIEQVEEYDRAYGQNQ